MPKELKFYTREGTITFDTHMYAYNKGSDARMVIERETTLQNGRDFDNNHTNVVIKDKFCLYGLTYKDLKDLAKWATLSANAVKKGELAGKYGASFNKKASVNDDNKPKELINEKL